MSTTIEKIKAQYIIDSRGNPTVEANVLLSNGISAIASSPSGASTGEKEALELRDNKKEWAGKGVNKAVENINKLIAPLLIGKSPFDIKKIDNILIENDNTNNKSKYGANAILATSLAVLHAAAKSKNKNLFEHIAKHKQYKMPIPMMNILNGGSHADNNIDIQEFMIMPLGFDSFSKALQAGVEIFHNLKKILQKNQYNTSIGDEGGFAPTLKNNEQALDLILEAIKKSNYTPGKDVFLALDVAASELYNKKTNLYFLDSENKQLSSNKLIDYYKNLCDKYPIISIEDGLDQNDWEGWQTLTKTLGDYIQIVGDDLTVTNTKLLQKAINTKSINAILIKLNQIGTVTETLQAIKMAKNKKLGVIISHRSGETEDTTIADLSVACNAGQIKTGSLCRTDRTAKYNQLLRIEKYLGKKAIFPNIKVLGCGDKENKK